MKNIQQHGIPSNDTIPHPEKNTLGGGAIGKESVLEFTLTRRSCRWKRYAGGITVEIRTRVACHERTVKLYGIRK